MALQDGLYDLLLTEHLAQLLSGVADAQQVLDPLSAGATDYLVDSLARQLGALLDKVPGEGSDQAQRQLSLVNELLVWLRERLRQADGQAHHGAADGIDLLAPPARLLRAVYRVQPRPTPPELGLAAPWLFTAGKGSPSLLQEIRRELVSSDRVDILVSFITVSGVRKLQDVLHQITARGADAMGDAAVTSPRLRILTTTYTGATEARALDELARLPSCEVRVSLDGRRTRLHAKA